MRNQERIKNVSPQEMSDILEECKSFGLRMIRYGDSTPYPTKRHAMHSSEYSSLSGCFLICEKLATLEITTSYHDGKPTTFVTSLNELHVNTVKGQRPYMQFQRAAHIPTLDSLGLGDIIPKSKTEGKYLLSATPILGSKSSRNAVFSNVYEYDINSAYSSVLLQGVPLFSEIDYNRVVRSGEIGFLLNDNLSLCYEGEEAEIICPIVPCPTELKAYIFKWYNEKLMGISDAKAMLNFPIGYFQRTNPLFRAYVVNSCNDRIRKLISKSVFMWNTDAIFSTEKLDLDIGERIGQWKEIKINTIKVNGLNYQIDNELPTYRAIPKYWFQNWEKVHGRPFDILKDELPKRVNKWSMNWKTLKLEEKL